MAESADLFPSSLPFPSFTGGHWSLIKAPSVDHEGRKVKCDVNDMVRRRSFSSHPSSFSFPSAAFRAHPLLLPSSLHRQQESCSLHLHSVTQPHNYGRVFSTPAPGFVMGVGTVGSTLLPYDECDTFLSTDAGITWRMVEDGAMKYEFGDQGSVIVMVEDEEPTDEVKYSFDMGKTWCASLSLFSFSLLFRDLGTSSSPSLETLSLS
jgi:hypothetical protein